ncbi:ABC transporter permease [Haloechinothrix sp. LS1_15]|uniref:ABC transporter permease n=1 Tax=Haloechinothrix sp. LS1_15 TaxID=2652248 RepID=UPI0029467394|nr:ABC transporter permease [Haloechinothrix sp. LS1_15]MDV6011885.1 ABC transporter permease [Haloechinothrix sp. LS1_15]
MTVTHTATRLRRAGSSGPAVGTAAVLACLVLWELAARGPLETAPFPTVGALVTSLLGLLASTSFWSSLGQTLTTALVGLALATGGGILLGMLLGSVEFAYRSTRLIIEILKPIPPIVIMPLVLLLLGPSTEMGVVLVFYGCLWPILIQTIAGVRDADPVLVDTARSFGFGTVQRAVRIVLPGAAAFIVTGVRIAGSAAFVIAVVSELVGGAPGIGRALFVAQGAGLYADMYALVVVMGTVGLFFHNGLRALERRALHWHPSVRGEVAP